MFDIAKYLEKFTKLSTSRSFLRESVASSIKEVCGFDIDPSKIDEKEGIVRISERPIIKSEIFLKKQKILKSIESKIGLPGQGKKVTDIL
jgi:hypothetical protein